MAMIDDHQDKYRTWVQCWYIHTYIYIYIRNSPYAIFTQSRKKIQKLCDIVTYSVEEKFPKTLRHCHCTRHGTWTRSLCLRRAMPYPFGQSGKKQVWNYGIYTTIVVAVSRLLCPESSMESDLPSFHPPTNLTSPLTHFHHKLRRFHPPPRRRPLPRRQQRRPLPRGPLESPKAHTQLHFPIVLPVLNFNK